MRAYSACDLVCFARACLHQEIKLEGLASQCHPSSTATDKLATLRAIEREKEVAKPFPYMEMSEWLPSWAAVPQTKLIDGYEDPETQTVSIVPLCCCLHAWRCREMHRPAITRGLIWCAGTLPFSVSPLAPRLHRLLPCFAYSC